MKDNKILEEIGVLSRNIQRGVRTYYNARIIEFLAEIIRLHDPVTVHALLKWLDTDDERKYYNDKLFPDLGIEL